ncbi:MAG: response regulator transcription factor [Dehalococcoidales bacterium]|nr:response regulator transcription factor [Dehalococcoidales bacterium]
MKFLILETDPKIINDLSLCLQVRYPDSTVLSADLIENAKKLIISEMPDLVIISSPLSGISLTGIVKIIRAISGIPLLVMSDSTDPMEIVRVLEAGADEYMGRSFSALELFARCKALLRRTSDFENILNKYIKIGDLTINLHTREVHVKGKLIRLSPMEYNLLSELARNQGRLVSTRSLLDRVWGPEYAGEDTLVKTCIYRLRSKLKDLCSQPRLILNERGFGYRLVVQETTRTDESLLS